MYQELTTDEWMSMLIDQMGRSAKQENKQPHPRSAMTPVSSNNYTSNRKLKTQYERMLFCSYQKPKTLSSSARPYWQNYLAQAIVQACHMLHIKRNITSLPDCLTMHKNAR